jgi:hypothetical protein
MTRPFRYRIAFSDWYDWLPYRNMGIRALQARARHATHRHQAVVIVDRDILDRWRHGAFASPQQLQQAQYPK